MWIRAFEIVATVIVFFPQSGSVSAAAAQTESDASLIHTQSDIPSVYQTLGSYFSVGAAIWPGALSGPHAELLVAPARSALAIQGPQR